MRSTVRPAWSLGNAIYDGGKCPNEFLFGNACSGVLVRKKNDRSNSTRSGSDLFGSKRRSSRSELELGICRSDQIGQRLSRGWRRGTGPPVLVDCPDAIFRPPRVIPQRDQMVPVKRDKRITQTQVNDRVHGARVRPNPKWVTSSAGHRLVIARARRISFRCEDDVSSTTPERNPLVDGDEISSIGIARRSFTSFSPPASPPPIADPTPAGPLTQASALPPGASR